MSHICFLGTCCFSACRITGKKKQQRHLLYTEVSLIWDCKYSAAIAAYAGVGVSTFALLCSREYSVTYRDQFKAPPAGASASFKRRPDRYGMVCQATVNEAAFAYGDGWGARASFDTTLGGAAKLQSRDETTAQYRTVTRDAMEAGAQFGREAAIRTAREAAALAGSEFSRPAGGRSNLMLDRGRHTAGISGEMLCLSGDPKKNTIAQRSWMYGPDPGLKFTLNKPEARAEVEGLSLDVRGIPPSAAAVKPGATHGKFAAFQVRTPLAAH